MLNSDPSDDAIAITRIEGRPMAAYATDIARQDPAVQDRFAAGVARYIDALASCLPYGDPAERRRRAIAVLAGLVGGMALARSTAQADPKLSAELLADLRHELGEVAKGQSR